MCASEEEKDARETNAEAPPGIETEHHDDRDVGRGKQDKETSGGFEKTGVQCKGETGDQLPKGEKDEGEMINLEAGHMRLEEQIQGMYHKMGEVMSSNETSMDDWSAGWRREGDGDEWHRWNGYAGTERDDQSSERTTK